jgi:TPP-dependent pyruvate/acetoin dehydrogenase alpha subunit
MPSITSRELLKAYESLVKIRMVEERISTQYGDQKIRCPVHLSIGQEAVAVGICEFSDRSDLVVSSHRAHAHYLAKGGDLDAFVAEIYGKASGCSGGRGGSMHLVDRNVGFVASTAIVGNTIPVGVGLAMSLKLESQNNIVIIFFGEGATEEGVFYESLNIAAVKELPCLFVCENNRYSVYTNLNDRQPQGRDLRALAAGMGVESMSFQGNDLRETLAAGKSACSKVRAMKRPIVLEFKTYRYVEHCGPDSDDYLNYRPIEERTYWYSRDPIRIAKAYLIESKICTSRRLAQIERELRDEIDGAFERAETAPYPSFESLLKNP